MWYGNPAGSDEVKALMTAGAIGLVDTPAQRKWFPDAATWCADNGCFGKGWPGEAAWWSWLSTHDALDRCAFAVAPDVVADAAATLEKSAPWLERIRELGVPAALVAQDGLEDLPIPWDTFDVLFIGGSTEWKLSDAAARIAREAKARGKGLHMGRVNSRRRFAYALSIGCDSADGTLLTFGADKNLPHVLRWLRLNDQPTFEELRP